MWHAWGGRGAYRILVGRPKGKRPLGRPRRRWGELDSASSGWGPVVGFCEHGNEPSGSIKKQNIFEKLMDNQLFK